jgi:hypothetical protein
MINLKPCIVKGFTPALFSIQFPALLVESNQEVIMADNKSVKGRTEQKRLVLSEIQELQAFRRVLRREHQEILDDLGFKVVTNTLKTSD